MKRLFYIQGYNAQCPKCKRNPSMLVSEVHYKDGTAQIIKRCRCGYYDEELKVREPIH